LFGRPEESRIALDPGCTEDIPQVTPEENQILVEEFMEDKVRKVVFQMEHNKALGPDGFPAEFYQVFWDLIKNDIMTLFGEFHRGNLPLYNLNFGAIILFPKCVEALKIQQYRHIYLLNVSFKIFTKVITNMLAGVAQRVIQPTQSAFLPGRNIMEGVVILQEIIHELHRKESGVIIKIDFKKAYDKVKWPFVKQVLEMKGFSNKWCNWMDTICNIPCYELPNLCH
jgi:hypothetical protein